MIHTSHRFSMLELIAVMVLMVIMLSLSAPAIERALRGSGVSIGAREIGTQVYLARQYAQANRRYVAVIMPGASAEDSGVKQDYLFTCSRLAFVSADGNDWNFDGWVPSSQWRFTNKGVAIMEADSDIGINLAGDTSSFRSTPRDNYYTAIDNVELEGIGGSIDSDGIRAIVLSPTGRVKGTTRFITVGEANYSGNGTWVIKNPAPAGLNPFNESCQNQITIEINEFTGGASYWTPDQYY